MRRLKRYLALIVTALTLTCVLTGCNTTEGLGRDIEEGGEAIQDVAD